MVDVNDISQSASMFGWTTVPAASNEPPFIDLLGLDVTLGLARYSTSPRPTFPRSYLCVFA